MSTAYGILHFRGSVQVNQNAKGSFRKLPESSVLQTNTMAYKAADFARMQQSCIDWDISYALASQSKSQHATSSCLLKDTNDQKSSFQAAKLWLRHNLGSTYRQVLRGKEQGVFEHFSWFKVGSRLNRRSWLCCALRSPPIRDFLYRGLYVWSHMLKPTQHAQRRAPVSKRSIKNLISNLF